MKKKDTSQRILTIPNILSFVRLMLIPVIIWLYCDQQNYALAAIVLVISGITDVVDGFIARRFNMVSEFGKAFDPVADKLTQGATLLCLGTRFPVMYWLAGALVVKESITGIMSLFAIKSTGEVKGANWHGKITTCLLYATMGLHIIWIDIPHAVTLILSVLCFAMMVFSFILYFKRNWNQLRK